MATYTEVMELIATLPVSRRTEVHELWAQATGYVWGWQDGGAAPRDSETPWRFGLAYAWHAAQYAAEQRVSRYPIKDAFREWCERGEICDPYAVKVA